MTISIKQRALSVVLSVTAALGFVVVTAPTASATTDSASTACYYGSMSKVHTIAYDNGGRRIIGQSYYNARNQPSNYRMLANIKVEVWSAGRYYVVDPIDKPWLPSSKWTIRFTDHVYRYYSGAWHHVAVVQCKVYR